jgi:membrane protease YdiL (CAAX protease family)
LETIRTVGPALLALLTALGFDWATRRRGLNPPGFDSTPMDSTTRRLGDHLRQGFSLALLWVVLWVGVFMPLGALGLDNEIDVTMLSFPQLFLLHGLLILCVVVWYVCGYVAIPGHQIRSGESWQAQLGFRALSIRREIGLGLVAGVGAWLAVLTALVSIGMAIWWLGGEGLLPKEPPALIPWMAALPIGFKLLLSLSAGVVEETFFRGFLQPRFGIAASTALFVLAHASYEQPLMLVGITILSLIYGALAKWRQNIWPAIAAHFLFDAIQLLVVIPTALDLLPDDGEGVLLPVASSLLSTYVGLG